MKYLIKTPLKRLLKFLIQKQDDRLFTYTTRFFAEIKFSNQLKLISIQMLIIFLRNGFNYDDPFPAFLLG